MNLMFDRTITLNELIEELQDLSKEHGDEKVECIENFRGMKDGKISPYVFSLSKDRDMMSQKEFYITRYKKDDTKEGHWCISSDGYYPYCSLCKCEAVDGKMAEYCCRCGAKLRPYL